MEPEIRYARTSDGLNIAYYAMGEGLTLIVPPPRSAQPIREEWNVPAMRSAAEFSSRSLQYVRYDPRGVGLSDPHMPITFTIDVLLRDLEAVADAVSPDEPDRDLGHRAGWGRSQSPTRHAIRSASPSSCCGRPVRSEPTWSPTR